MLKLVQEIKKERERGTLIFFNKNLFITLYFYIPIAFSHLIFCCFFVFQIYVQYLYKYNLHLCLTHTAIYSFNNELIKRNIKQTKRIKNENKESLK